MTNIRQVDIEQIVSSRWPANLLLVVQIATSVFQCRAFNGRPRGMIQPSSIVDIRVAHDDGVHGMASVLQQLFLEPCDRSCFACGGGLYQQPSKIGPLSA